MKKLKSFPLFLIVLGLIILLETTNLYNGAFMKLWPILLIVLGSIKVYNSFVEEKH